MPWAGGAPTGARAFLIAASAHTPGKELCRRARHHLGQLGYQAHRLILSPLMVWVLCLLDFVDIKSALPETCQQFIVSGSVDRWCSAHYPEVSARWPGNDRVSIVLVQLDDPVVRREEPDWEGVKADAELGRALWGGDSGVSLDDCRLSLKRPLKPLVFHPNPSVLFQVVFRRHRNKAPFKEHREFGYLVLNAHVAFEVNVGDCLRRLHCGASGENDCQSGQPRIPCDTGCVRVSNHQQSWWLLTLMDRLHISGAATSLSEACERTLGVPQIRAARTAIPETARSPHCSTIHTHRWSRHPLQ